MLPKQMIPKVTIASLTKMVSRLEEENKILREQLAHYRNSENRVPKTGYEGYASDDPYLK